MAKMSRVTVFIKAWQPFSLSEKPVETIISITMSKIDNVSFSRASMESKKNVDVTVADVESTLSLPVEEGVFHAENNLERGLKQRHIQMLSLVGVFGTGLFLSSGKTLALCGNVGMVLSYLFVGILVGMNQLAMIELSCLMPVTGSYIRHGEHFIDGAFSFSLGWICVYLAILPSELAATSVVMGYWSDLNPAVWITIFLVVIIACNSWKIRFYGDIEFGFGVLKILLIVGLILLCAVMDLGGVKNVDRIGFRYWKQTPFMAYYTDGSLGKFLSWWKAVGLVVFSFGGVNAVSFFAGETQRPRYSIYVAGKRVFYRVFVFYLLTVFGLTLILPADYPGLANSTGDSTGSPFVIAIHGAGIKVLPDIINAIVLTSAFSAANLSMFQTSRDLFALAAKGQAPKIFLRTNRFGLPYCGVIVTALFLPLAYMSASTSSSTVFGWFQNLTSANLLVTWMSIDINHIGLHRALKAQGYTRKDLPYTMPFADYAAWISLVFFIILLLTGGFTNFLKGNFDISSFFSSYFVIPLYAVLFLGWKFFKKTSFRKPLEVDLLSLFRDVKENPEEIPPPHHGWRVIKYLWE